MIVILILIGLYISIGLLVAMMALADPQGRGAGLFFRLLIAWPYYLKN